MENLWRMNQGHEIDNCKIHDHEKRSWVFPEHFMGFSLNSRW